MPRTLRQLWADEDETRERAPRRRQRRMRLVAKQGKRLRGSAVVHGRGLVRQRQRRPGGTTDSRPVARRHTDTTTVARPTTATPPSTPRTTEAPTPAAACAPPPWAGLGNRAPATPVVQQRPAAPVRAGRQECSDRVMFRLNGPDPVGYSVRYVDLVREDGSGRPVPVAGGAALQVTLKAPALGHDDHGYVGKVLAEPGADFYTPAQLGGWSSLRGGRWWATPRSGLGTARPPAQISAAGNWVPVCAAALTPADRWPWRGPAGGQGSSPGRSCTPAPGGLRAGWRPRFPRPPS